MRVNIMSLVNLSYNHKLTYILYFCLAAIVALKTPCHAQENKATPDNIQTSAISTFIAADMLMDSHNFEDAIDPLKKSLDHFGLIGDYILIRLARAYEKTGRFEESNAAVARIIDQYPHSPVMREALQIRTKNNALLAPQDAIPGFVLYLEDYPSDEEIRLQYARALIAQSSTDKADEVLKSIYIDAGPLGKEALSLLSSKRLTANELAARASNLYAHKQYSEAAGILRELLRNDDIADASKLKEQLAMSLFRMRRYTKAAPLFEEVGDLHNAARSYIRSGRQDEFHRIMELMITTRDNKAPVLMVAHAKDLLKDGNYINATKILQRVIDIFPRADEEAAWTLGWHYFTIRKYDEALDKFAYLCDRHPDDKYTYWQARALEKSGKDASELYARLSGEGYYPFMASLRSGVKLKPELVAHERQAPSSDLSRIDLLIDLGLTKEAAMELSTFHAHPINHEDILAVAYRMQTVSKYREAMQLMLKLPENKRQDDILYPLAYWETVKGIASEYKLDPFLVLSLIREESRFDSEALSPVGAMGLMQLMPETARRTARKARIRLDDETSIYEVEVNIQLGTHYLNKLLREFKSVPASLAAYNAGETRVRRWLRNGNYDEADEFIEDIPFNETRNYVKRIMRSFYMYKTCLQSGIFDLSSKGL